MGWRHPYDAISRALPYRWARPYLSAKVQELSHPERRAFLGCMSVRGAKRSAGGLGQACRAMAMGIALALDAEFGAVSEATIPWPIARLPNWTQRVNKPLSDEELDAVRRCVDRGQPFGDESWIESIARRLNSNQRFVPTDAPRNPPRCIQNPKKRPDPFSLLFFVQHKFSTTLRRFQAGICCDKSTRKNATTCCSENRQSGLVPIR